MINIALLGFGQVGQQVYAKLTNHPLYKTSFTITWIQTQSSDKGRGVYQNELIFNTSPEGMLQSDQYDTVIDCTEYNEQSKQLIFKLLKKGVTLHTCSKELVWHHFKEMLAIAAIYRSRINFNSIPASPLETEYSTIELTDLNFAEHENESLYVFRGADASVTANQIVIDIVKQASNE
jgi:homoserine dehydrogenase